MYETLFKLIVKYEEAKVVLLVATAKNEWELVNILTGYLLGLAYAMRELEKELGIDKM